MNQRAGPPRIVGRRLDSAEGAIQVERRHRVQRMQQNLAPLEGREKGTAYMPAVGVYGR